MSVEETQDLVKGKLKEFGIPGSSAGNPARPGDQVGGMPARVDSITGRESSRGSYLPASIVNFPNENPRSTPLPVPLSASEISPLVTTCAETDLLAPACAVAFA